MKINKEYLVSMLAATIILATISCSTMVLKKYPKINDGLFSNAPQKNGISVISTSLLDDAKNKEYFGVELLEYDILPVHIAIRNDNPSESFIISSDSIQLTQEKANVDNIHPESGDQAAGNTLIIVGAALINIVWTPILIAAGTQQMSDASIIKEHFESAKFRTVTLDPKEIATGFLYFKWGIVINIDKPRICIRVYNPVPGTSFPYCFNISTKQ